MTRLLDGPPLHLGAEPLDAHRARLGPLPDRGIIDALERAGVRGRGGAAFPTAVKWRAVAARSHGRAVVLANGAEGEPRSAKDRLLMTARPHLVLDGVELACRAVSAREAVLYIGAAHEDAAHALQTALRERDWGIRTRVVRAPARYVAGEESAAVHCVNDGVALPTSTPPRPFERGVDRRPTLVNNVETLAQAALVARDEPRLSSLLTVSGAVLRPGVVEADASATVATVVQAAGGTRSAPAAVLLGGYFGAWAHTSDAWSLATDPIAMRAAGHSLGCGVLHVLDTQRCGLAATADICDYLASESARQCGPCVFGLAGIAAALRRVAHCAAEGHDLARIERWVQELPGRGACHHPDGAATLVRSALRVFNDDVSAHVQHRTCLHLAGVRAA